MKDLKHRALRGGAAKLVAQGANFVLRLGSIVVLARLLDPRDFGLVGMVTVVTGAFNLFKDAGLSIVTVQSPDISDAEVTVLFWVNIVVGTAIAGIVIGLAPVLVTFYSEPRLFGIAVVLGVGFIVNAAGVQHSALLQRAMRFGSLAAIEIVSAAVSVSVGIGLALVGAGYWALVWTALSAPMVSTCGAWLATRWVPGLPVRGVRVWSMLRTGGAVTLNSLIVYVAYNADKMLIGRVWGADALGLYGRAYQLVSIPTDNLNAAIGGVAVSALSRVQDDGERFKRYFLKSYSLVLALTLPVTISCALFANEMIGVLLGAKWMPAAPVFRALAPTIVAFALLNPLGWMLFASGRVERSLKMAVVIAPVVIAGYVLGIHYGTVGVAAGYSIAMAALVLPMIAWAIHRTQLTATEFVRTLWPLFGSSAIACAVSVVTLAAMPPGVLPVMKLVLGMSVLIGTYLLVLLGFMGQWKFYLDLMRDLSGAVSSATPAGKQLHAANS